VNKDSKFKIANQPSQFQANPNFKFRFYYLLKFNSSFVPLGNRSCSAVLSLKVSRIVFYFVIYFIYSYFGFIWLRLFPANIPIKRKVLAQSFQDPPVSKQSMQGASKVQKAKAKPRVSIVSPLSPQNSIV
jgi:hypothetical protein